MPQHAADFPFAYRLPTDVALQIRDTGPALVTMGSPRRRLVVLVLTFAALAGGLAATLPVRGRAGDGQAGVRLRPRRRFELHQRPAPLLLGALIVPARDVDSAPP